MRDNVRKGDIFEKYIASLYEALNFNVTTNVTLFGQQVDIIAKKIIKGVGETNLIIECKYLTKGKVSNQVIYDFTSFINSIPNQAYRGVIVTNSGFSKEAKSAAEKSNITLLTQEKLESEILSNKEPFFKSIKDFENQDIFHEYISQFGLINKKSKLINIEDTIKNYTYNDWRKISFITVLGDYGAGKTTLLNRLNYIFSQKYLEGDNIKPILFELKNFHKYGDLDSFILNRFIKVFQKELPVELIWKSIESGSFLILLDGFDEMSPQTNPQIRNENLAKLAPLLLSNSNTIITCRPSYFISKAEYDEAVSNIHKSNMPPQIGGSKKKNIEYRGLQGSIYKNLIKKYTDDISIQTESKKVGAKNYVISISDFSDTQIDSYLKKFNSQFQSKCHSSWSEIKSFLVGIYDIKSLLKKPILLSMIKDTMLDLGQNYDLNNELYDPASLYEIYTNANIARDWSKGETRQFLTSKQRLAFAEILAHHMFVNDNLEVHYSEITTLIQSNKSIFNEISIFSVEEIASDIQICSFVKRTEDETFRFIHKSFMEFFVAKKLLREFNNKKRNELYSNLVPKDILYFIGCYSTADENLENRFVELSSPKKPTKTNIILRRNSSIAYLLSKSEHLHLEFRNILIESIDLKNLCFKHCVFENLTLENVSISSSKFTWGSKVNLQLNNCDFTNLLIDDKSVINLTAHRSEMKDTSFNDCNKVFIKGENNKLKEVKYINCGDVLFESYNKIIFQKCLLSKSKIIFKSPSATFIFAKINNTSLSFESTNIHISNSEIKNTSISFNSEFKEDILKTNFSFEKSIVHNATFERAGIGIVEENKSSFKNCVFNTFVISRSITSSIENNLKRFQNCHGVVVLFDIMNEKNRYIRVGKLILINGAIDDGFIKSKLKKFKIHPTFKKYDFD